jgi:hypothetical protein
LNSNCGVIDRFEESKTAEFAKVITNFVHFFGLMAFFLLYFLFVLFSQIGSSQTRSMHFAEVVAGLLGCARSGWSINS